MLKPFYTLVGAIVLGAAALLFATLFFPIFVAVMICLGIGFFILELLGAEDPAPGMAAAANQAVYHTGRIITLLVFSPLWVPLWVLKFVATRTVGVIRDGWRRRERRRQVAQDNKRAAATRMAESRNAQTRREREEIILSCELFYNVHAPAIRERLTKADLADFIGEYMGPEQPVEVVRRRANQLVETIRLHVEAVDPPEEIASLEDLTRWYAEQKSKLEGLDIDSTFKEDYLVQLNERFAELSQRMLEVLKP